MQSGARMIFFTVHPSPITFFRTVLQPGFETLRKFFCQRENSRRPFNAMACGCRQFLIMASHGVGYPRLCFSPRLIGQKTDMRSAHSIPHRPAGWEKETPHDSQRPETAVFPGKSHGKAHRVSLAFRCVPSAIPPYIAAFPPLRWSFPFRCQWQDTTAPPPVLAPH